MDTSNVDPVYHAWVLNHSPQYPYPSVKGVCGRCSNVTTIHPIKHVVSRNFTDWDIINPESEGMCSTCVFSFQKENIIIYPFLITEKQAEYATGKEIKNILSAPLHNTTSLTFPISRKKHLLPKAKYGYIVSDKGLFNWGVNEAAMFVNILWLKSLGVKEKDLYFQSPPFDVVMNNEKNIGKLFSIWKQTQKWLKTPQFEIAVIASRDEKKEVA